MVAPIEKNLKKLTPEVLDKIQKILFKTDFSSLIRRQSVSIMETLTKPQPVFDEIWVEIADLKEMVAPEFDLKSDTWLFQHFTETLDCGVLKCIQEGEDFSLSQDISINLNVSTVLSEHFIKFDENVSASTDKTSIIIEVNWLDVLSDIKSFMLAKTYLHHKGYRVCLDGVPPDKLKYLNLENMDLDFIKIIWSPTLMEEMRKIPYFTDDATKRKRGRIILCRIDDQRAIDVGNSVGINFYQGRYIQKLIFDEKAKQKFL